MNLRILTGREAQHYLSTEDFLGKWTTLYERCAWATACQHPDFVMPWYDLYGSAFLPVVVVDERDAGSLNGLLTLALRPHRKMLTGAGVQQAEYQGWLQASDTDSSFMINALRAIRTQFPKADLCLKYLPPGIPLDWIDDIDGDGAACALRTHARPLMQIDAAAMTRQRNKKNHRQNYNRLGRLGEVAFENVVEHARFVGVFDEIARQYDFRQGALFRSMPFLKDPLKKPFHIELQKRGLLHTTVLTVGEKIAAAHIGLFSKERAVHLGINTYNPALAAHSPGNLLLAMLGVHLVGEGLPVLDLTPGGDKYKEQFATGHDAVAELMIYRDPRRRLINETRLSALRFLKAKLRTAGYRPADLMAAYERIKESALFGWREIGKKLHPGSNRNACQFHYRPAAHSAPRSRLAIAKNCLNHVFTFDAGGASARYYEFLDTVMKRLERLNDLFSYARDGRLEIFCWARSGSDEALAQASAKRIVLFDLYVHPQCRDRELVQDFIAQLAFELQEKDADIRIVYAGALTRERQTIFRHSGFMDEMNPAPVA